MLVVLPDLAALLATTGGVFVRADLARSGHSRHDLQAWLDKGHVRPVTRGVYTAGPMGRQRHDRLDELTRGVARLHGQRIAASHHSALLLHGLALYGVPLGVAHAVRTSGGVDSSAHLTIWRPRTPPEVVVVDGVRTVTAPMAIAQVAAHYGLRAGVVAGDSSWHRRKLARARIEEAVETLGHVRGIGAARAMLERLDPGSQSPGETLLRLIAEDLGYAVQTQFPVLDDTGRAFAYADLRLTGTRSLWEFDGAMKYEGADGRQALMAEKLREDRIRARGWGLERVVWAQLANIATLADRIRKAAARHPL